ncbi:MAG TPA: YciI family protein [Methylomirabilota bacterium]|nr:YciI family protein [Methylomirabilota bacterium]
MRYMLLMYRDESVWDVKPEAERLAIRQQAIDFSEKFRAQGVYLGGSPLLPTSTATTVRLRGGKVVTTDGPFAETKEQLGGYTILEAKSLDEAIAFAVRNPLVLVGGHSIEIRPLRDLGSTAFPP